ncbi:MAG: AraC family transcriptional regulator [Burkholderiaceae bacterium]
MSAAPQAIARAPLVLQGHHVRRLEGVVDFVDAHLDAELSLEKMATIAAISPFHFHRLFQLWSGETLNEFVRRRRLDVAAGRLRHCTDEKITAIALNCGFASAEGFARAFRERFGMTPSRWRGGGWAVGRVPANDLWQPGVPQVAVAREPTMDMLFMRGRGDFGRVAPHLWERFLSAVRALGLAEQPLLFMGLDDPGIVGPARCRMDACVQLPAGCGTVPPCPPPLLHKRLPARWVATLEYDGPAEDIAEGWTAMLTQWLPQSAYKLAIGPFFERYDPAFGRPGVRSVRCRLGMPVEPRAA